MMVHINAAQIAFSSLLRALCRKRSHGQNCPGSSSRSCFQKISPRQVRAPLFSHGFSPFQVGVSLKTAMIVKQSEMKLSQK
jgi:hypothetical protein